MPELLSAIADLAWPIIVLVGLILLSRPLAGLLRSGSEREEVTIEVGGQRLTLGKFREQQNETVVDLRRQIDDLRRRVDGVPPAPVGPEARHSRILWVDDQPQNNALLIDQLMSSGVTVDLARTTAEGLALAGRHGYGAVITDMSRDEDGRYQERAGLDLVRQLRAAGDTTPVMVFTSSRSVRDKGDEARHLGAQAVSSSGVDLVAFLRAHGVME
ncbi:MAG: response regulator [Pseudonocardia sp.]